MAGPVAPGGEPHNHDDGHQHHHRHYVIELHIAVRREHLICTATVGLFAFGLYYLSKSLRPIEQQVSSSASKGSLINWFLMFNWVRVRL